MYILVTKRSRVVYHGMIHQSLEFFWYTHKPLRECVYHENTNDKWEIPWYTTRERCITILYNSVENTVTVRYKQYDIRAVHDGTVRCNAVEYTSVFQYSDW